MSNVTLAVKFAGKLKDELNLKINKKRTLAFELATLSIMPSPDNPDKKPEVLRVEALKAYGNAIAFEKLLNKCSSGIEINFTGQQCYDAIKAIITEMQQTQKTELGGKAIKALRFSEMHPDYGQHQSHVMEQVGVIEGFDEALKLVADVAQSLESAEQ